MATTETTAGAKASNPEGVSPLRHLRFRASLWLWARLLPFVAYRRALTPLLELVRTPVITTPYRGLAAGYIARRVKRVCRRPWAMRDRRCLREGLLAYRFLSLAGYAPRLRFGVERTGTAQERVRAHCWVDVSAETVLNPPSPSTVEILRYGTGGAGIDATPKRDAR
jgi:transglutaminase superfamily protein